MSLSPFKINIKKKKLFVNFLITKDLIAKIHFGEIQSSDLSETLQITETILTDATIMVVNIAKYCIIDSFQLYLTWHHILGDYLLVLFIDRLR